MGLSRVARVTMRRTASMPSLGCRKALRSRYSRSSNRHVPVSYTHLAGDTGLFSSMELIGSLYPLDLALLPVGGFFTMDGLQAAHAARLLKPKAVIPMHLSLIHILVVMDCDLQDPPHKIALLLEELQRSGKEAIFAIREHRKDCFLKKAESHVFNTVMRKLTNRIYHGEKGTGNFSIITHRVVLAYRKLREHHRCYGSIIQYCGFELAYLPIEGDERFEGSSSYTFLKSIRLAFSILLQQSRCV